MNSRSGDIILTPPTDYDLRVFLTGKLQEYEGRKVDPQAPWHDQPDKYSFRDYRDACYKRDIISAVLESSVPVSMDRLAFFLGRHYSHHGIDFSQEDFDTAVAVIQGYLESR